jgi:hypothetical protein
VAMGAWLHLTLWKRRIGPGGNHGHTLRYRPGGGQPYLRALDDRFQPGVPPTDDFGGPLGKGVPYSTAEARPFR